jgi:hypothetical protein
MAKPTDRNQLLDGGEGPFDPGAAEQDQRQRLLAGTNRLGDASKRLADSHRIALETEQVGADTLEQSVLIENVYCFNLLYLDFGNNGNR